MDAAMNLDLITGYKRNICFSPKKIRSPPTDNNVCVCLFVLDSPGNDCLHGNHPGKKSAARLDIHVCGHVSTSYQTAV